MRSAIDGHRQAMTRHLIGRRPSDHVFRQVADLGTAIVEGEPGSVAKVQTDEILMKY
jgi:hypothetical protein